MEYFVHMMEFLAEGIKHLPPRPITPVQLVPSRKTYGVLSFILVSVSISGCVMFSAYFAINMFMRGRISLPYLIMAAGILFITFVSEFFLLAQFWKIDIELPRVNPYWGELNDDVKEDLGSALLFLALSFIPIVHLITCQFVLSYSAKALTLRWNIPEYQKYTKIAANFIYVAFFLFLLQPIIMVFYIIITGDKGI
jgi:hypothetical protein